MNMALQTNHVVARTTNNNNAPSSSRSPSVGQSGRQACPDPRADPTSMVNAVDLKKRFETSSLSPASVSVEDVSGGCGQHFKITVVSSSFDGIRLLERHRLIHNVIGAEDMAAIHALQLKCLTPAQQDAATSSLSKGA
jgi:stress-induced morphogen